MSHPKASLLRLSSGWDFICLVGFRPKSLYVFVARKERSACHSCCQASSFRLFNSRFALLRGALLGKQREWKKLRFGHVQVDHVQVEELQCSKRLILRDGFKTTDLVRESKRRFGFVIRLIDNKCGRTHSAIYPSYLQPTPAVQTFVQSPYI